MIAYLDIETTTAPRVIAAGLQAAGLLAPPTFLLGDRSEAVVAWVNEHAADRARDPVGGVVVCWAVATSDDREIVRSGPVEADLLRELEDLLLDLDPSTIVAHFGHGFDFPFLRARGLACGLPVLARLLWSEKPWDTRLIDTTAPSWAPVPARGAKPPWPVSLDLLAELLGIGRPLQLDGSQVPAAWYRGEIEEIEAHCLDDVRVLRRVTAILAEGRGS